MMQILPAIHQLFFFLGTPGGELVKKFIELILFIVVDYMILSEYSRNKKEEYKFLIIAFTALVIQRMVSALILFFQVFGSQSYLSMGFTVLDHIFEILAVFLVAVAFLYPAFREERSIYDLLLRHAVFIFGFAALFSVLIYLTLDLTTGICPEFFTNALFIITKLIVLYGAVLIVFTKWRKFFNYRANITMAFIVYSVAPLLLLIDIIYFGGKNTKLVVASHPFPFLSVLLFTRVIYLKLVDKATLRTQLRISRRRYQHEIEVGKLKDEFVSVVSHELKTPITSIKLYLSLLRQGKLGGLQKKQKDALHIVDEETNRLNGLINDVLDLSKLESSKANLKKENFDLHPVINNQLYLNMAKEKGVVVVNKIPKNFIVFSDQERFRQVFINLFSNSLKFTPRKGKIILSAKKDKEAWYFIIQDTGKGIEDFKIPRLFDKFYQADDSMTRKAGGFGLGLAIVKRIVDLHGGTIEVRSELGKGTAFRIRFPSS